METEKEKEVKKILDRIVTERAYRYRDVVYLASSYERGYQSCQDDIKAILGIVED